MKFLNLLAALIIVGMTGIASAQTGHQHANQDRGAAATAPDTNTPATEQRVGDPWPLDTCVVAENSKLGSMGDVIIRVHEGREVRFCCSGCIRSFEANPKEYLDKADAKIIALQKQFYPLDYCIIDTHEAIEEDESRNDYSVVNNRLFVYCCPPCDRPVRANPEKYIAMLDEAVADAQRDDYPLETCVVSGLPLDSMGGAVEHVVGNQLVKVCCAPCIRTIEQDPAGILGKLAEARAAASEIVDE